MSVDFGGKAMLHNPVQIDSHTIAFECYKHDFTFLSVARSYNLRYHLIGKMYQESTGKLLGYICLDVKNKRSHLIRTDDLKRLIEDSAIYNARLRNNRIELRHDSINNLPIYIYNSYANGYFPDEGNRMVCIGDSAEGRVVVVSEGVKMSVGILKDEEILESVKLIGKKGLPVNLDMDESDGTISFGRIRFY